MTEPLPLLVFTDLDGTLLSHDGYEWNLAQSALDRLAKVNAGVVLASSKTAPEIAVLRREMALDKWPAIVENGSGVLPAGGSASVDASAYTEIRGVLDRLRSSIGGQFKGFGDMHLAEIVAATGLTEAQARLAKQRSFSEPGLWTGSEAARLAFCKALESHGIATREGGRFLTLSFGQTKADRMEEMIADLKPRHTIALGDAPNDIEMLEAADFAVVVQNPHRPPLPPLAHETDTRVLRTDLPGPAGWNAAILSLLDRLNLT